MPLTHPLSPIRAASWRVAMALALPLMAGTQAGARPGVDREAAPPVSAIDSKVIEEINFARTRPGDYAQMLRMEPGTPATAEAIGLLQRRMPVEPLTWSARLAASAARQAADQGSIGGVSHTGSDGTSPGERMRREGVWSSITAEDIALQQGSAHDVVRQLIIDEGVPTRGHRTDLLDPHLRLGGAGCAPHRVYRIICVIDLAAPPPPP
jgi:uncharacterized protein YkwD